MKYDNPGLTILQMIITSFFSLMASRYLVLKRKNYVSQFANSVLDDYVISFTIRPENVIFVRSNINSLKERLTLLKCKISLADKIRMQTLHKQGLNAKAINAANPAKHGKLSFVKKTFLQIDLTGSVNERQFGSRRPTSVRASAAIDRVREFFGSQAGNSGTHLNACQVAAELNCSERSVRRLTMEDPHMGAFRRVPAQIITNTIRKKKLEYISTLLAMRHRAHVFR
jgi:hypothetical protein